MQYEGRISDHIHEDHDHGHDHGHGHGHGSLDVEQTRTMTGLVAVLAGAALVLNGIIIDWFVDAELGIGSLSALVGAVLLAIPIFRNAVHDLLRGHVHMSELAAAAVRQIEPTIILPMGYEGSDHPPAVTRLLSELGSTASEPVGRLVVTSSNLGEEQRVVILSQQDA